MGECLVSLVLELVELLQLLPSRVYVLTACLCIAHFSILLSDFHFILRKLYNSVYDCYRNVHHCFVVHYL